MAATLHKLRTKSDMLKEETAVKLRQLLLEFPDLPERARSEIAASIDRQTAADKGWTFIMLSAKQNAAVVTWLLRNSKRPHIAVRLWAELFDHLRTDTGQVILTRTELAGVVGTTANNISAVMSELESIGAITKRLEKVNGLKGRGIVFYFMNPRVATNLTGMERVVAQNEAPNVTALRPVQVAVRA